MPVRNGKNPDHQSRIITIEVTDKNNPDNVTSATITQLGQQTLSLNVNLSNIKAITTSAECQISYSPDICYVEIIEKENPGFVTMQEGWEYESAGFCSKKFLVEENTTEQERSATYTINMYLTKGGKLVQTTEYILTQGKSLANVSIIGETITSYEGSTDNIIMTYDAKKALLFKLIRSDSHKGADAFETYFEDGRRCNQVEIKNSSALADPYVRNKPEVLKHIDDPDIYWILQNGWFTEEESGKTYTVYFIPKDSGFDITRADKYFKAEIQVPAW